MHYFKTNLAMLLCALCFFINTSHAGSWGPLNTSLAGGAINDIAIDPVTPTTVFAGASGVFYKSIDSGITYSPVLTGLPQAFGNHLVINPITPSTMYIQSFFSSNLYKSVDGGINWTLPNAGKAYGAGGIASNAVPTSIVIDPITPTTIYLADPLYGIFKSTDGGNNWVNPWGSNSISMIGIIDPIIIDPNTPSTLYVGMQVGGIYKSLDSAATWVAINAGLTNLDVRAMVIDPLTPSTLYAGTFVGGIFKSVDSGATWAAMNTGLGNLTIQALAIDPLMPAILYAATAGGVFQSVDGGSNWAAINTGLASMNVLSIAIDPKNPSIVYVGNDAGIQKGVFDSVVPVISLSGNANVSITQGIAYTDAGATALDNVDGNITANIVVANPVNTAVVGSYTITYNVSDAAGNAAVQVSRVVHVTAAGTTANGSAAQVVLSGGGTVDIVSTGQYISSFSALAATGTVPAGMQIPFGTVAYQTTSPVGGNQTVTLTFNTALPTNTVLYKVDNAGVYTLLPKATGANAWTQTNANTIAVTLTDGGQFDLDGAANGVIVDPLAVGTPAATPTALVSGGGGGCAINPSASFDPTMLFLMLFSIVWWIRQRKYSDTTID